MCGHVREPAENSHGALQRGRTYRHVLEEVDGLSVVDAETATVAVSILLALSVAEILVRLSLITVAAGELGTRSLCMLAAPDLVRLAHAFGVVVLLELVVGILVQALPLLVNGAEDPTKTRSSAQLYDPIVIQKELRISTYLSSLPRLG